MQKSIYRVFSAALLLLGMVLFAMVPTIAAHDDDAARDNDRRPAGAVFVGTNHSNLHPITPDIPGNRVANQVVMYHRFPDGTLRLAGYFPTGGQGSGPGQRFAGDGLGSSHSLQLSADRRWLFVANAGSDTLSVFRVLSAQAKLNSYFLSAG